MTSQKDVFLAKVKAYFPSTEAGSASFGLLLCDWLGTSTYTGIFLYVADSDVSPMWVLVNPAVLRSREFNALVPLMCGTVPPPYETYESVERNAKKFAALPADTAKVLMETDLPKSVRSLLAHTLIMQSHIAPPIQDDVYELIVLHGTPGEGGKVMYSVSYECTPKVIEDAP